jgi:hypothetical protein
VQSPRRLTADVPEPGPRVQPRAESPEGTVVRRSRKPGEAERRHQELAALVEHGLLDDLIGLKEQRLRNRQAERLGSLEVDA